VNEKAIRVLLAESNILCRQCLGGMLTQKGFKIVGETARISEISDLYLSRKPDVIIMDTQLSDGSGLDFLADFLPDHPQLPVLIISSSSEPEAVEKALSLGVKGYYTRQASLNEIIEAIIKMVEGERAFHNAVLDTMVLSFQKRPRKHRRKLEEDEIKILKLCSEGKTYAEISRKLFIGERTLYRKLNKIFEKLGVSNKMQALTTVIKKGII